MEGYDKVIIKDFRGGIAQEADRGPRGSYRHGRGINTREGSNTLKCNQKLTKDSASVVEDLVLVMFRASDGYVYGFGDTGKIYRKKSGAWLKVHTDSDGKITGACEFTSTSNTFILYATATKLKKITLANAGTSNDWSVGSVITEVGTFTDGRTGLYHTMKPALGVVMVNDGAYQAIYDYDDAFNPSALQVAPGLLLKTLLERRNQVIMGTVGDGLPEGWVTTWDRLQDSWLDKKPTQADGVHMAGFLEGGMVIQVGDDGTLKYWNFSDVYPLLKVPNTSSGYPGGVAEYRTLTHFGLSGGTRDGVYSIGRINKNDVISLVLEYVPSHGKITGTEIGALANDGSDLYVAWKDGSTYGIDKTDSTAKATFVYESLQVDGQTPDVDKDWRHIKVVLEEPLPENCSVVVKYRPARKDSTEEQAAADSDGWILASMSDDADAMDTEGMTKGVFNIEGQGEYCEVQVTGIPSGNTGPEVKSITVFHAPDNTI